MLTLDSPVDLHYDPYSIEALRDPTDLYRQLRAHYPAYPLPQYGAWAISRFDDVWRLGEDGEALVMGMGPLFDPATLTGSAPPAQQTGALTSFSQTDPPLQTTLRQAVGAPLRPRAVARLEDDIRRLARRRLDELVPTGRFDLYADYGGQVSAAVMCRIIGLPVESAAEVLRIVNASMRRVPPGSAPEAGPARLQMHTALVDLVRQRRSGSSGSSPAIDGLLGLQLNGRQLTDDEVAIQLFTILTGGTETVPKVVARCVLELHRRPDQLAGVLTDPAATCAAAYEEALRFGAPLQYVGRTAARDLDVAGAQIRAGQRLFLLIASANRDEREFVDPDEFRWDRSAERHLAFGHGLHFCIGSHVARLEGQVLLEELFRRVPAFDLDESAAVCPPSDFQIGYVTLPIVPRASGSARP